MFDVELEFDYYYRVYLTGSDGVRFNVKDGDEVEDDIYKVEVYLTDEDRVITSAKNNAYPVFDLEVNSEGNKAVAVDRDIKTFPIKIEVNSSPSSSPTEIIDPIYLEEKEDEPSIELNFEFEGASYEVINDDVVVKSDDGFRFIEIEGWYGADYFEDVVLVFISSSYQSIEFDKDSDVFNSDMTVATIPLSVLLDEDDAFDIYGDVEEYEDDNGGGDNGGDGNGGDEDEGDYTTDFITVFKATYETLTDLSKAGWLAEGFNVNDYIYKIYELPLSIPDEIVSDETLRIKIGEMTSPIKEYYLERNKVEIELGEITVENKYNNAYDYKDTTTLLHVPYLLDPIELELEYVIGETIIIFYSIDFYTGDVFLNIKSERLGVVFKRVQIDVIREIPFHNEYVGFQNRNVTGYKFNDLKRCFIEVVRNVPYGFDDLGKRVSMYDRIGEFSGYIEMNTVKLEVSCTLQEKNMILSLLKGGVFINED